jgi:hypothetical protein
MKTKQPLTEPQKQWLAALRSGKYKQGKNRLHKIDNTFCCLGVACDIFREQLHLECKEEIGSDYEDVYLHENGCASALPEKVQLLLNLRDDLGYPKDMKLHKSLIALNDIEEKSFSEIADIIEANPEAYFIPPQSL